MIVLAHALPHRRLTKRQTCCWLLFPRERHVGQSYPVRWRLKLGEALDVGTKGPDHVVTEGLMMSRRIAIKDPAIAYGRLYIRWSPVRMQRCRSGCTARSRPYAAITSLERWSATRGCMICPCRGRTAGARSPECFRGAYPAAAASSTLHVKVSIQMRWFWV